MSNKSIPDNLDGLTPEELKKIVFEGLLGNMANPYEGLGSLDTKEVRDERERNKPKLYIVLKHNYSHAGSWLMYAADDESIYRYIFYKFFENFIECSSFFENLVMKQTPAEIAAETDPATFTYYDIKEMIDGSDYIGDKDIFAFRITELTMTTLPTVKRLREKLPDPADLIPHSAAEFDKLYDDSEEDEEEIKPAPKSKGKKAPKKTKAPKKQSSDEKLEELKKFVADAKLRRKNNSNKVTEPVKATKATKTPKPVKTAKPEKKAKK